MLANTLAKKVGVSLPHIFQIFYKIDSQFTRTFMQSCFLPLFRFIHSVVEAGQMRGKVPFARAGCIIYAYICGKGDF